MNDVQAAPPALPASATQPLSLWAGVLGLLLALLALRWVSDWPLAYQVVLVLGCYALPIALVDVLVYKVHLRPSAGLDFSRQEPRAWRRIAIKLWGLYGTFGIMAGFYALLPEYTGGFYTRYWLFLKDLAPLFIPASLVYFIWLDRYMRQPQDGFYHMGLALLGQTAQLDTAKLRQHLLGWGVKYFFLPLMFIYVLNFLDGAKSWQPTQAIAQNQLYGLLSGLFFGVDLVIVTVGYFLTLRVFDSHMRSTEPTLAGWFWALLCYEPIWSFVAGAYINYNSDGVEWYQWLSGDTALLTLWAAAILLLTFIYMMASVAFGLRFSNLTNRGIITNGVYAWCKHPAYVSKNLSWWLIAVPFVWHDKATFFSVVHDCVLLLALNGIYFLRARTEERHYPAIPPTWPMPQP